MDVTRHQQGQVVVLSVRGPIVAEEMAKLSAMFDGCIGSRDMRIVLELRGVPFIDSQGLESILEFTARTDAIGGNLRLSAPNDLCRDILAATRVDGLVHVYPDHESAVRSLL